MVADRALFAADGKAGAERMGIVDDVGSVALDAVAVGFARDVGGDAVDQEVADLVRHEMQEIVACEIGQLPIKAVDRTLQGEHAELGVLILVFVERRRVEIRDPERAVYRRIAVQADGLAGTLGI